MKDFLENNMIYFEIISTVLSSFMSIVLSGVSLYIAKKTKDIARQNLDINLSEVLPSFSLQMEQMNKFESDEIPEDIYYIKNDNNAKINPAYLKIVTIIEFSHVLKDPNKKTGGDQITSYFYLPHLADPCCAEYDIDSQCFEFNLHHIFDDMLDRFEEYSCILEGNLSFSFLLSIEYTDFNWKKRKTYYSIIRSRLLKTKNIKHNVFFSNSLFGFFYKKCLNILDAQTGKNIVDAMCKKLDIPL